MRDRQRTRNGIGRYAILCVTGAILGTACADPALADAVKAEISKPIPAYRVVSNGSSYTQVQGVLLPAKFTVEADAEIAGKVTAISYKASAATSYPGGDLFELSSQSDSRHFDPVFDKELLPGRYQPAAGELAAACNQMADGLRARGIACTDLGRRTGAVLHHGAGAGSRKDADGDCGLQPAGRRQHGDRERAAEALCGLL